MITLNDLFDTTPTIVELHIVARDTDLKFLHGWYFGEYVSVTSSMEYDQETGRLSINKTKINHHGDATRGGPEIGWGVKEGLIPKALREAPVTRLTMSSLYQRKGTMVSVDVEMHPFTVQTLVEVKHD